MMRLSEKPKFALKEGGWVSRRKPGNGVSRLGRSDTALTTRFGRLKD